MWKATREILGTIFGANGYKRGDWPRPIHHRAPPQLFPSPLSSFLAPSLRLSPLLSSSSLSSLLRKKGRVARNKTHPSRSALSAVDKQASNNVMNLSFSSSMFLFRRFHGGRAPIVRRGCETMKPGKRKRALSLFDALMHCAHWNSIPAPRFEIDSRFFAISLWYRKVNSWREKKGKRKKKGKGKTDIYFHGNEGGGLSRAKGQVERFSSESQRTMDQRVP